jgi:uncharacterized membrane protein YbaN (DUF454 family)
MRAVYLLIGLLFVGVGAVGVVLPGLPTTPFLLISLWAFARSSPRFHNWLYNHRYFGPGLRRFSEHRVIPLKVKLTSLAFMVAAVSASLLTGQALAATAVLGATCAIGSAYIWSCPSHAEDP